jgi:hypothetical protein
MKQRSRGFTRRQIAAGLAVAAPSLAQTPARLSSADELAAAKAQSQQNSAQLRKFYIPPLLDPSFAFKP